MIEGKFEDGKPVLRMQDQESRENTLRLLTLLYTCNNAHTLDDIMHKDIFAHVRPTEENIEWFKNETKPQLSKHRRDALLEKSGEILQSVDGLLETIFPPIAGQEGNKLWSRLHTDEKAFVSKMFGREYAPNAAQRVEKRGWMKFLSSKPTIALPEENFTHRDASFGQKYEKDLSLIADRYRIAFEQYPKLQENVRRSDMLNGTINERNFGTNQVSVNSDF